MSEINYKILLLFLVLHRLIMQQENVVMTEEFQSLEDLIREKLTDHQQVLGHELDVSELDLSKVFTQYLEYKCADKEPVLESKVQTEIYDLISSVLGH
jgi:hypothetical protein